MKNIKSRLFFAALVLTISVIGIITIFTYSGCSPTASLGVEGEEGGIDIETIQSFEIGRGSSKDVTIGIERIGATTGNAVLSVLETVSSDVTITFDPNPIPSNSNSSNMHIEIAPNAQIEDHLIKVQSKIDPFTDVSQFTISIVELAFSMNDLDPITIIQGEAADITISLMRNGVDPIRLEASGFPAGVDTSFNPNPSTTSQSILTLTVDPSVAPGDYNILITGINGDFTVIKGFVLTVASSTPSLWVDVTPGNISNLNDVFFINENSGFAVGNNGTIYSTGAGGVSGSWVSNSSGTSSNLNGVHSDGTDWYAVGDGETILKNTGSGWTAEGSDITNDLLDVFVVNSNKIFISGKLGKVYRTENGGGLWDELEPEAGASFEFSGIWVNDDSVVTAVTRGSGGRVYRSTNNGTDWTRVNISGRYEDIKYADSQIGFAVGQDNLIDRTTDGGESWNNITLNLPSDVFVSVSFFNSNVGYVVGNNQLIWRAGNGGGTANDWVEENRIMSGSNVLNGVAALNTENAIAVGISNGVGIILRRQP